MCYKRTDPEVQILKKINKPFHRANMFQKIFHLFANRYKKSLTIDIKAINENRIWSATVFVFQVLAIEENKV